LGLGNAATPFGLKAMIELNKLNKRPGVATDAMCLFAAINTSNVAILPLGVIALRASMGSAAPAAILITTFLATLFSTTVAVIVAHTLARFPMFSAERYPIDEDIQIDQNAGEDIEIPEEAQIDPPTTKSLWIKGLIFVFMALLAWAMVRHVQGALGTQSTGDIVRSMLSTWLLPLLIVAFLLYGTAKDVKVYGSLVSGAKEGFDVALKIIPFLVAILVAVGMFRASGAMDMLVSVLSPVTTLIGFPGEALPMALLRPLSGSGAYGVAAEIMQTNGPDSFVGYLVSTMQGSTETTFYVLALYFGAAGIRYARHALIACLIADTAGIAGALVVCRFFFMD
jgi:spore maturation protein SpmB